MKNNMRQFLLKLIDKTKTGELKWSKSELGSFSCDLDNDFSITIFKNSVIILNSKDSKSQPFMFGERTSNNIMLIRLWNLVDSKIEFEPNIFEDFIYEYVRDVDVRGGSGT